ncbi:MAG: nuclear transport factor 2 family protein [Candidatus Thorarchaeota archaeon]|jgi:uncharacterized protein (TIGR02246 family)
MEEKEIDELIEKHMKAAHALDLDSFMETWADDAEFTYLLSNKAVKGKDRLRPFFHETMFAPVTKLKTEITQQVRFKQFRTYVERVVECSNPDFVGLEFHWTLEFEDGKIKRLWALQ